VVAYTLQTVLARPLWEPARMAAHHFGFFTPNWEMGSALMSSVFETPHSGEGRQLPSDVGALPGPSAGRPAGNSRGAGVM
jgi:hypothetical protein